MGLYFPNNVPIINEWRINVYLDLNLAVLLSQKLFPPIISTKLLISRKFHWKLWTCKMNQIAFTLSEDFLFFACIAGFSFFMLKRGSSLLNLLL